MVTRMKLNGMTVLLVVITLTALLVPQYGESGPLRDRERFNIKGDGFWMKGRCFMPGSITIPDEYNFVILSRFDDFGCLVKNRRGKRRVRKRNADVNINLSWVVEPAGSSRLEVVRVSSKTCNDVRRCRVSVEEPLLTGTPVPRPWKVVGMIGDICGKRSTSEKEKFSKPRNGPHNRRLDWCYQWGAECGSEAANMFCRKKGYDKAVKFKKDPGVKEITYVSGAKRDCHGAERHCDSFKFIKCERAGLKKDKLKDPRGGPEEQRLDWCRQWGAECGRPAADTFCRRKGYDQVVDFKKDPAVKATTFVTGAERECRGDERHCDSFKFIKCGKRREPTQFSVHVGRTPGSGGGIRRGGSLARCP